MRFYSRRLSYKDLWSGWPGPRSTGRSIVQVLRCASAKREEDTRVAAGESRAFRASPRVYTSDINRSVGDAIRVPRDDITWGPRPGHRPPRSVLTRFSWDGSVAAYTRGSLHREEASVGRVALAPRLTCVAARSLRPLSHLHIHARLDLMCDWLFPGTDDPVYNSGRSRPCRAARSQSQSTDSHPAAECTPRNRAVAECRSTLCVPRTFFTFALFSPPRSRR